LNFSDKTVEETRDLNENILIEHAARQTNVREFSYEQVAG